MVPSALIFSMMEKNLLDDDRREAEGRLIKQEQRRTGHDRAGDRQHLLFAAGQRAARLGAALGEDGEQVENVVEVLFDVVLVVAEEGPKIQILLHGEIGEDQTAFRHLADAERYDLVRPERVDGMPPEEDFAAARRRAAADGHQRGALARAVGPDERDDFPFVDAYVHVPEGLDVTVEGVDVAKLKHGRTLQDTP